ncbi:MAG TPA: hypothetical protein VGJ45_24580 [Pseudonocardiaceae bacterium]
MTRRLGMSPSDPGSGGDGATATTSSKTGCPDIWQLSNGDVAIIGRDLTEAYRSRLPDDVSVAANERLGRAAGCDGRGSEGGSVR